jgi:hypothetical protein
VIEYKLSVYQALMRRWGGLINWARWLMPLILTAWEAEVRRLVVRGQPRQKVCEIPS